MVTAGTSDLPVAEEAVQTPDFLGVRVERCYDVEVAGLHRLLAVRPQPERAAVVNIDNGFGAAVMAHAIIRQIEISAIDASPSSSGSLRGDSAPAAVCDADDSPGGGFNPQFATGQSPEAAPATRPDAGRHRAAHHDRRLHRLHRRGKR